MHRVLVAELKNITHWPKHVLLRYEWMTENDVDLDRGLYVLFAAGKPPGLRKQPRVQRLWPSHS